MFPRLRKFCSSPRCRQVAHAFLFLGTLLAVLYFALVPNVRRDVLKVLPGPVRSWCGLNDDLSNFLLFAILAFVTFRAGAGSRVAPRAAAGTMRRFELVRLIALLGLVVALEVAQIWIPGRYSSVRDVLTGGGGVMSAWLLSMLVDRLTRADR